MAATLKCLYLLLIAASVRTCSAQLCSGTMCNCANSSVVDCSNLGLTSIPQFSTFFQVPLDRVDFSGNEFVTFDPEGLSHFIGARITTIDLSNNRLTSFDSQFSLANISPGCEILNISNNDLTVFPAEAVPYQFMRVTLVIDISDNLLTSLPGRMMANNIVTNGFIPNLEFIARNNMIDTIDHDVFVDAGINELRIDLRDNRLANFPQNFYYPASKNDKRDIKLSGNPWLCDCDFRWISRSFYRQISQEFPPICMEPLLLRDRPLFDLREDEFVCSPIRTNDSTEVDINLGDNILECPVTANPESTLDITWILSPLCNEQRRPFELVAQSRKATLKSIRTDPKLEVNCTASNYAGSINTQLDLTYKGPLKAAGDSDLTYKGPLKAAGDSEGNGWVPFLIIMLVLSLLSCAVLTVYYIHLRRKL